MSDYIPCDVCNGTGLDKESPERRCKKCHGAGEIKSHHSEEVQKTVNILKAHGYRYVGAQNELFVISCLACDFRANSYEQVIKLAHNHFTECQEHKKLLQDVNEIQAWLRDYEDVHAAIYSDGSRFAANTSEHISLYANGDSMIEAVQNWKAEYEKESANE
jgi:hypothetical protein